MIYPDPSVLVAIYVGEPGGDRLDEWLDANADRLAISGWVEVEFASALALKERAGAVPPEKRLRALALFEQHWVHPSSMLAITASSFQRAATMISEAPGLRAGDALHLAIAEQHGATLVTLDRQQAELGQRLGVPAELL